MEDAVEKIAILSFITIGLSHIFQPKVWSRFFIYLAEKAETGSFINGFIHFPFGVLIVVFHNVWSGIPLILTLIGYAMALKGAINFVFPRLGLASIRRITVEKNGQFVVGGLLMTGIGCLLLYSLLTK